MRKQKYYVYALIDPRDGQPFYIGKGCGKRCFQHVADVRKGRTDNIKKQARIRDILRAGLEVGVEIRSEHDLEGVALAAEAEAIQALKTFLTNIMPHGAAHSQEAKRQAAVDRAQGMLDRMMPFDQWCAIAERSESDKAVHRMVEESLRRCIADPVQLAREVAFVNGRVEFRW